MKDKKPLPSYHHGDLRNALINAGVTLLQEEGVSALTLRKVARRAEVSHAAPYRHFTDKNALLTAIALQGFQMLAKTMEKAIQHYPGDAKQRLVAIGEHYIAYGVAHPAHLSLMFSEVLHQSKDDTLNQAARYTYELLHESVKQAQHTRVVKAGDSNQIAVALWSLVHGMTMLLKENLIEYKTNKIPGNYAKEALEQLLKGVAPS